MLKNIRSVSGILALSVMVFNVSKASDMYSFVNIHGNGSSLDLSNNYYYTYNNNCCYNNGYYNYNSNSAQGGGGGAALRFVIPGGFMFDASYNTDEANVGQGDVRINQGTAGLGYRAPNWYAEAIFTTFQPKINSFYLCGGNCGSVTYNGGGAKGGYIWTFARQWYATADAGLAVLGGRNGSGSIAQGILGGSVGYKFTPNFSVDLGVLSNAWFFDNSNNNNNNNNYYNNGYNTTVSVTSIQAGISLHF
jgi:hypothetical protein